MDGIQEGLCDQRTDICVSLLFNIQAGLLVIMLRASAMSESQLVKSTGTLQPQQSPLRNMLDSSTRCLYTLAAATVLRLYFEYFQ